MKTWYEIYTDEINQKGSIINYVNDKIKTKKAKIFKDFERRTSRCK